MHWSIDGEKKKKKVASNDTNTYISRRKPSSLFDSARDSNLAFVFCERTTQNTRSNDLGGAIDASTLGGAIDASTCSCDEVSE